MRVIFAGHEIDLRRHELRRGGRLVHVEPQVFDLLVHLVRHRDRVVSKDELLDAVWNGRIVSEAALSSRINAARKAIGDDGDRQGLIRTIHRRGFRFLGEAREVEPDDAAASPEPGAEAGPPTVQPVIEDEPAPRRAGQGKPAIAVLPTVNAMQDPELDYFAYGMTEDIIRLLARNRWLDVLSRHSTYQFRDRQADPRDIGTALGARYLVQCTVWKRGERVRITADLVSAESSAQLWSEAYDQDLAGIFDVQDAMAQQIAAVIEPELARLERESAVRKPPGSLDAWDCFQRGLFHLWGFTCPSLQQAETMFRRAIALDPSLARAHGALGYVHLQNTVLCAPEQRGGLLSAALAHARTAVALDDLDCVNHCVLGRVLVLQRRYEEGIAALEQSIALNASFAQAYFALGHAMIGDGRPRDALAYLTRATELSPRDPHLPIFYDLRAVAYLALGEEGTAAAFAHRATRLPNASYRAFSTLVAVLGRLGRLDEAAAAREELLRRRPEFSCAFAQDEFFYVRDDALVTRFVEGLRLAGVPERQSAPALGGAGLAGPARARPAGGRAEAGAA